MSDLGYYVSLLEDTRRIASFGRAIASVVREGDHVLEVGCGLGTYALMAARAGARRVTAVERHPVALALMREIGVERLGESRIRIVEGAVETMDPSDPADVVIFEDFGSWIFRPGLPRLFTHVRERLARPEARWIPDRIEIVLAPLDLQLRTLDPESPGPLPFPPEAIAMLRKRVLNDPTSIRFGMERLAGPGAVVGALRMSDGIPIRARFAGVTRASRDATITALGAWMTVHVAEGEALENSPAVARSSWNLEALPFEHPLRVQAGDELRMELEAAHGPGPAALLGRWSARGPGGAVEGSSSNSIPGDVLALTRGSPGYVPMPAPKAPIVARLLQEVDGRKDVSHIARSVYDACGSLLPDVRSAEGIVLDVIERLRGVYVR